MQAVQKIADDIKQSSTEDLKLWKDPKCSGIVFGLGLVALFFFSLSNYCIFTALLTTLQIVLVVTFVGGFLGMKVEAKDEGIVTETLESYARIAESIFVPAATGFLMELNKVVRWVDYAASAKWLFGSLLIVFIITRVSIFTLCLTAWVFWWTLFVAYDKNKEKIDPVVANAKKQFEEKVKTVPKLAELLGYTNKKVE